MEENKICFNKNLYGGLLDFAAKSLYNNRLTINGCECDQVWHDASIAIKYFVDGILLFDEYNEVKFFILADYLTYVPYGKEGYKFLENILNNKNESVANMRFKKLRAYLDRAFAQIPEEQQNYWLEEIGMDMNEERRICEGQYAYIKAYFDDYNDMKIDLTIFKDIVKLFCRFYHECEARFGMEGFESYEIILDKAIEFARRVDMLYSNGTRNLDGSAILSEYFDALTLNDEQKKFIVDNTIFDDSSETFEYFIDKSTGTLLSYNQDNNVAMIYQYGEWKECRLSYEDLVSDERIERISSSVATLFAARNLPLKNDD